MDLAENRFGKTWKHFLEVLKVDYNCSLADVCRDQHTTLGGMSSSGCPDGVIALNKPRRMWSVIIMAALNPPDRQLPLLRSLK